MLKVIAETTNGGGNTDWEMVQMITDGIEEEFPHYFDMEEIDLGHHVKTLELIYHEATGREFRNDRSRWYQIDTAPEDREYQLLYYAIYDVVDEMRRRRKQQAQG